MKQRVRELMNKQINHELESAYLYLEFSNYFDSLNLNGYSDYYRAQAKEEIGHALKFLKYLLNANEKVQLMVVHAPDVELSSVEEVLNTGLKAEEDITKKINEIYEAASSEKEYSTKTFLNWFINEQFIEEKNAKKMIDDYKLFKNNLFELDKQYAKRRKEL